MTKQEILSQALTLEWEERESLAEELLLSLPRAEREAIDAAWLEEAKRRDTALINGQVGVAPVEEVITRLLSRARR